MFFVTDVFLLQMFLLQIFFRYSVYYQILSTHTQLAIYIRIVFSEITVILILTNNWWSSVINEEKFPL